MLIRYNNGDNDNGVDRYTGTNNVDLGIYRYGARFGTVEGDVGNENNGRRGYYLHFFCFGCQRCRQSLCDLKHYRSTGSIDWLVRALVDCRGLIKTTTAKMRLLTMLIGVSALLLASIVERWKWLSMIEWYDNVEATVRLTTVLLIDMIIVVQAYLNGWRRYRLYNWRRYRLVWMSTSISPTSRILEGRIRNDDGPASSPTRGVTTSSRNLCYFRSYWRSSKKQNRTLIFSRS